MISLILPYWDRKQATDESLALMSAQYRDLDLEVIVVDDGTPKPYLPPDYLGIDVHVLRLQTKLNPKNPCVPINAGVAASCGDFVAISNPEIKHVNPVLKQMAEECAAMGPDAYVLAGCWCPDENRWHCHTSRKFSKTNDAGALMPDGVGYHFLGMMHRSLWEKCVGFDEDYREGAGYDDPDFVLRMLKAGAKFKIRDDLVVHHPHDEPRTRWLAGGFERNRELFFRKWGNGKRAA